MCALARSGKNGGYDVDYAAEAKRRLDEADGTGLRLRWLVATTWWYGTMEQSGRCYGSKTVAKGHTVLNFVLQFLILL